MSRKIEIYKSVIQFSQNYNNSGSVNYHLSMAEEDTFKIQMHQNFVMKIIMKEYGKWQLSKEKGL